MEEPRESTSISQLHEKQSPQETATLEINTLQKGSICGDTENNGQAQANTSECGSNASSSDELNGSLQSKIKTTRRDIEQLHRKLLPKQRQLLMQKEETALEVSKYFSELKMKVSRYLLDQEQKVQEELADLTDKESTYLTEDINKCKNMLENIDKSDADIISVHASNSSQGQLELEKIQTKVTCFVNDCKQIHNYAEEPLNIRFMINTDLEDMLTSCNLVTVEVVSARHVPKRSRGGSVTSELSAAIEVHSSDAEEDESDLSSVTEEEDDEISSDDDGDTEDSTNASNDEIYGVTPVTLSGNNAPTVIVTPANNSTNVSNNAISSVTALLEDEPPPPYPGLPENFIVPGTDSGMPRESERHRPIGNRQSQTVVYPTLPSGAERSLSGPTNDNPELSRNNSPLSRSRHRSSDSVFSQHGQEVNQRYSRKIQRNDHENKGRSVPIAEAESIHPELRLPSSADSLPSAPPMTQPVQTVEGEKNPLPSRRQARPSSSRHEGERSSFRFTADGPQVVQRARSPRPSDETSPGRRRNHLTKVLPFSIKIASRINSAIADDERPPGLVGVACMVDYIVVVDRWNCKLKLLQGRSVKGVLLFGNMEPWDVTAISDHKCAVVVPKASEICIVVRQGHKLRLDKKITSARGYACITYCRRDNTFICGCCPQFGRPHVAIVSMEGHALKVIKQDANNEEIFAYPRVITLTNEDTIVVVDGSKNCVIFVSMDGAVLSIYKGTRSSLLKDVQGVVAHPFRRLVILATSNTLHILTNAGEHKGCIADISSPKRMTITGLNRPMLHIAHGNGYVSRFEMIELPTR